MKDRNQSRDNDDKASNTRGGFKTGRFNAADSEGTNDNKFGRDNSRKFRGNKKRSF